MTKIGLFSYGHMGASGLNAVLKKFEVLWIILPAKKEQNTSEKETEKIAIKNNIPVHYIFKFSEIEKLILKTKPEIVLICSFNKVLPGNVLGYSKFVNVHLGDLPRMRGRANVNWAIINGEKSLVISIHSVSSGLDEGNIYAKFKISISEKENVGDIYKKINSTLESKLSGVLRKVNLGYKGLPQKGRASYCATRIPDDGYINFAMTTKEIDRLIRATTKPYPGAFTYFENKKMIILRARIPKNPKKYVGSIPGRVSEIHSDGVEVLTGDSSIIIEVVEFEGKEQSANSIIKSIKKTLGVDIHSLIKNK